MTTPAHAPQGTESDSLLTQIHVDNVLQVRNVLLKQERDMTAVLLIAERELKLVPPGQDPVSGDAVPMFQAKLDQIVDVHWAHVEELKEATDRLHRAALHYGFTDDEISDSFSAHNDAVGPILDR